MLKKFYWHLLYSEIGKKIILFLQNFSANQISIKNGTQLFDCFVIGIERWVNSDAEKILFAFVVFSKSGRKIFFSMKIFQPMRFWEKIKFNFSIILWLESSDESTVMLKKFYWPLLYSPNRGENNFFFMKIFQPIRFREKIKFNEWWCGENYFSLFAIEKFEIFDFYGFFKTNV